HALPQLAVCLRDHGLEIPAALAAIADHREGRHQEWRFAQGENCFAALYHYKGEHFAMGSTVHYRWDEWGYQETVLHLRVGETPEAAVWINHPGESIQFGYGRPSYWGGCGTVPRIQQYRGLAVLEFRLKPEQPEFTHAWFPQAEFDEVRVSRRSALARSGGGAVFLKGSSDLLAVEEGPTTGSGLRQQGATNRGIVTIWEAEDLQSVETRFSALAVTDGAGDSWTVEDPEYGPVRFLADGSVEAEGRRLLRSDY